MISKPQAHVGGTTVSRTKHESNVKAMRLHAKLESAIVGALERKVHSAAELSADIQAALQGPTISSLDIVEESTQLVQPAHCQPKGTVHTLTFHDLGAEDMGFVSTGLVFRHSLEPSLLRAALSNCLSSHPALAGRLDLDDRGNWYVHCNDAGVALRIATSPNTSTQLLPQPEEGGHGSRPFVNPDLSRLFTGGELFGPQSTSACFPDKPMLRVAVVQLADGATLLAMSMLHILGDFSTMRTFLESWAAAYNGGPNASEPLPVAAPLMAALEATFDGHKEPTDKARQYVWQNPGLGALVIFCRTLYSNWWLGNGTVQLNFHITADRLRELKDQALADLDPFEQQEPAPGSTKHWVSTNDALIARLWQVLSMLPPKAGVPFPLFMAVDLRRRFPDLMPRNAVGNLAGSAQTPEVVASQLPLGQLALLARQAIERVPVDLPESLAWSSLHIGQVSKHVNSSVVGGPHSILIAKKGGLLVSNWDLEPALVAFGSGEAAQPVAHLIGRMTPLVSPANVFFVSKVLLGSAHGSEQGVLVSAMLTRTAAKALLTKKVQI